MASTSPITPPAAQSLWDQLPTHWPAQGELLHFCQHMNFGVAILLIMAGLVYLLFGYYLFKWLVTLNATIIGTAIGAMIGQKMGSTLSGAIMGGFISAVFTWPAMKYAVSIMGALMGALVGAVIWRAVGLDPSFAAAGAMMGLILFGMLSFIIFRPSVILYTSLQGSIMLIVGLLGLIYQSQQAAPRVTEGILLKPFILPMVIFIAAVIGQIYQQAHHPADGAKE